MATRVHGSKGRVFAMPDPTLTVKTISAITKAALGEVTTTVAHGLTTGQAVLIDSVAGMTEVNHRVFTIAVVDTTKFTLGVNTTAYTTYTSGGTSMPLGKPIPITGWEGTKSVSVADAGVNDGYTNAVSGNKSFRGTVNCVWDSSLETAAIPTQVEEGDSLILVLFPSDGRGYWTVPCIVTEEPVRAQGNAASAWSFSFQNRGAYAWVQQVA